MNDWWFFIISDIVGKAQMILVLVSVVFLIVSAMIFFDAITEECENEFDRKKSLHIAKILISLGITILFFSTIILPSKQVITEAYIAHCIQQGHSLSEIQQHIGAIKECSKELSK